MARVRNLNQHGFDHGQVQASRHPIVQKTRVLQSAIITVNVFFVERPADALGHTTLHLAFNIARMNGRTDILNRRIAKNIDLAGLLINRDIHHMGGKGRTNATRVDRRPSHDWPTRTRQFAREFFEGHGLVAVSRTGEYAILKRDFISFDFPRLRSTLFQLTEHILSRFVYRSPGGKGHPTATGHIGMTNGLGIRHNGVNFFCGQTQDLSRNHGARRPRATNIDRTGYDIGRAITINRHTAVPTSWTAV